MLNEHASDPLPDVALGPEQFSAEHRPGAVAIGLMGEFDDFNAKHLQESLGDQLVAHLRVVDIDAALVTYLSSTAMRALIAFHDAATAAGAEVRIVRASYVVRRLLDIVGLAAMFGLMRHTDQPDSAGDG